MSLHSAVQFQMTEALPHVPQHYSYSPLLINLRSPSAELSLYSFVVQIIQTCTVFQRIVSAFALPLLPFLNQFEYLIKTLTMALHSDNEEKLNNLITREPQVSIFLRPIAAPAALGLAGFAGSTFITATWIARWWGGPSSPTIFFPFVAFWGGLAQFLAGLKGFDARDVLVTVIHCMWGSFWMSIGIVYLLVVRLRLLFGLLPESHGLDDFRLLDPCLPTTSIPTFLN